MAIWIIDDDIEFGGLVKQLILDFSKLCHKRATGTFDGAEGSNSLEKLKVNCFTNAIEAINCQEVPELIFLDILLDGPNGFTFLNEMRSYEDLAKVPVVIMSSLNFKGKDLSAYGVVGYLNKSEMTPAEVKEYVERYCGLVQGEEQR